MGTVSAKGKVSVRGTVSARECRVRIGERIREGVPYPHRGTCPRGSAVSA